MRITKNDLNNMVTRLNHVKGFETVNYNTVGAYRLYHDGIGYSIHKICNTSGGVSVVGNCSGMTTKECYYFLSGLLSEL